MSTSPVRNILLASPPGQFDIILEDVRSIAPPKSLTEDIVADIRAEWATISGNAIIEEESNDESDGYISALRNALDDCISLKYSSAGVRAAHRVKREQEKIKITIYAERIDLNNHSAGSWKSCYIVSPSLGCINGNVSITAHTFESGGNFQLHSFECFDESNSDCLDSSDGEEERLLWAKTIAKKIQTWEDCEVMGKLANMYERMSEEYLKGLRRVMPVTRTKMDWNVMSHRVQLELGQSKDMKQQQKF